MTAQILEARPFILDIHSVNLSDEQFLRLGNDNEFLRLELTARGELVIMPGTGGKTGLVNANLTCQVTSWERYFRRGVSFDSSTMFCLPNGAKRSPDVAWLKSERWNALTEQEQEGIVPLCPDFVLELRSSPDSLSFLQEKMEEYVANGAQLGLLIDLPSKQVYLYRPNRVVEMLDAPASVNGDPLMPEFFLDLNQIW